MPEHSLKAIATPRLCFEVRARAPESPTNYTPHAGPRGPRFARSLAAIHGPFGEPHRQRWLARRVTSRKAAARAELVAWAAPELACAPGSWFEEVRVM